MRSKLARNAKQKISFFTGLAAALVGTFFFAVPTVFAQDCGPNAIMTCGFTSNSSFIKKVKANDDGHGHHDLQAIFAHYGLTSGDYNRFASSAVSGTVYKDGRIVVNGKTVARDVNSLGRTTLDGRHNKSVKIGGKTYYYGQTSRVFLSNSIPAKVLFNSNGEVEFTALTDCGNPVWGTPVKNSLKCQAIKKAAVSGKTDTFNFTTDVTKSGNATITKLVYTFSDDNSTIVKTSATSSATHTFKPGTWTVKVKVYASVPGGGTITSDCEMQVTVEPPTVPYFECVDLRSADPSGLKYVFTATARYGNGAKFNSGDFNFGDATAVQSVAAPANATTISAEHTYAKAGEYTASVTLKFTVNGVVKTDTCQVPVKTGTIATPECKPGIPVGDARCEVCQYNASLTKDDENCKAPCQYNPELSADDADCVAAATTLPNTGAGNVVALGAAALVGGFLFYRNRVFKKNKAAFEAAEYGASPLPLADPLATAEPLADTPVEPEAVRSSFRRRRQF